jgi:hypothetical protein
LPDEFLGSLLILAGSPNQPGARLWPRVDHKENVLRH